MKPLRLLVTYTAKPGQRDAFLRAVLQSGVPETVRQEDGCLRYDYFLSAERPDEILLIEEWGIGRTAADTSPTAPYAAAETAESTIHCRNRRADALNFWIFTKYTCFFSEKVA